MNSKREPTGPNPAFEKKEDREKWRAELLASKNDSGEEQKTTPTYEVVREGTDLQRVLMDRLQKAVDTDERVIQLGNAKPTGDQVEVVPETKVNEGFLGSLPEGREFVIYANAHDLSTLPDNLKPSLGGNTLIVFESDHRLLDELKFAQDNGDQQVA